MQAPEQFQFLSWDSQKTALSIQSNETLDDYLIAIPLLPTEIAVAMSALVAQKQELIIKGYSELQNLTIVAYPDRLTLNNTHQNKSDPRYLLNFAAMMGLNLTLLTNTLPDSSPNFEMVNNLKAYFIYQPQPFQLFNVAKNVLPKNWNYNLTSVNTSSYVEIDIKSSLIPAISYYLNATKCELLSQNKKIVESVCLYHHGSKLFLSYQSESAESTNSVFDCLQEFGLQKTSDGCLTLDIGQELTTHTIQQTQPIQLDLTETAEQPDQPKMRKPRVRINWPETECLQCNEPWLSVIKNPLFHEDSKDNVTHYLTTLSITLNLQLKVVKVPKDGHAFYVEIDRTKLAALNGKTLATQLSEYMKETNTVVTEFSSYEFSCFGQKKYGMAIIQTPGNDLKKLRANLQNKISRAKKLPGYTALIIDKEKKQLIVFQQKAFPNHSTIYEFLLHIGFNEQNHQPKNSEYFSDAFKNNYKKLRSFDFANWIGYRIITDRECELFSNMIPDAVILSDVVASRLFKKHKIACSLQRTIGGKLHAVTLKSGSINDMFGRICTSHNEQEEVMQSSHQTIMNQLKRGSQEDKETISEQPSTKRKKIESDKPDNQTADNNNEEDELTIDLSYEETPALGLQQPVENATSFSFFEEEEELSSGLIKYTVGKPTNY